MPDVTVNIRGNSQQLRDEMNRVAEEANNAGRGEPSSSDRSQGGDSDFDAFSRYERAKREEASREISERYDRQREEAERRRDSAYDSIDKDLDSWRNESVVRAGSKADDPLFQRELDDKVESERERRYRRAGEEFDREVDNINGKENEERLKVEKELVEVLRELKEQIERQSESGADPDSYLGRLRAERKALIEQRETAATEKEAQAAQSRIDELDKIINRSTGGSGSGGRGDDDSRNIRSIRQGQGILGAVQQAQQGNWGGAMVSGAVSTGNPYVIAGAVAAQAIMGISSAAAKSYESLSDLARFRSPAGGASGEQAMNNIGTFLSNDPRAYGVHYTQYGMDVEQFDAEAFKRVRARGSADNWYQETMAGLGLEKSLALDQGALMQGSQYDRYGINVTDALSRLVTTLSGIQGSGVSYDDFTRVQEKYDIQQAIMQSYMGRTDRPNYDTANKTLAAFSSVQGVTQDARVGDDIQQFQGMIQNPLNERMRTLVYSTIADLFPETGGRMDLIDRALRNPENEGQIMQAVVHRLTSQFGDTNTQMGYFAFKSLLPNIAPDRLDAYVNEFNNNTFGANVLAGGFSNQNQLNANAELNKAGWTQQAVEFLTTMTKTLADLTNMAKTTGIKTVIATSGQPAQSKPKSGSK